MVFSPFCHILVTMSCRLDRISSGSSHLTPRHVAQGSPAAAALGRSFVVIGIWRSISFWLSSGVRYHCGTVCNMYIYIRVYVYIEIYIYIHIYIHIYTYSPCFNGNFEACPCHRPAPPQSMTHCSPESKRGFETVSSVKSH